MRYVRFKTPLILPSGTPLIGIIERQYEHSGAVGFCVLSIVDGYDLSDIGGPYEECVEESNVTTNVIDQPLPEGESWHRPDKGNWVAFLLEAGKLIETGQQSVTGDFRVEIRSISLPKDLGPIVEYGAWYDGEWYHAKTKAELMRMLEIEEEDEYPMMDIYEV